MKASGFKEQLFGGVRKVCLETMGYMEHHLP